MTILKPEIIECGFLAKKRTGYIAGYCRCGRCLYVKDQKLEYTHCYEIECPCGETIGVVKRGTMVIGVFYG